MEEKQGLVYRDEFCQIRSVLFRCAQYDSEPLVPTIFFVFLGENIERERNKISLVCQLYPSRLIGMGMGGGGGNILLKPSYVLSSAEQDCHDQRMGKSDLEAVDKAVTCALENSKVVMVSRVVQDGLHCGRH